MVHDGSPDHGLGYIIARDGRIGLYYLKMFKIKSLLVMKFYQLHNQLAKSGRRKTTSKASNLLVKIKTMFFFAIN